jgi:tRNA G18 (ribose-2'-O)-methylase SpoU
MPERIHDEQDPRLAPYRAVGDHSALERAGLFVAEGRLVVERLLEDGVFAIASVLVTPAAAAGLDTALARRRDVAVYVCEPATLREITGFNFHRGCLALAHRPRQSAASDLLSARAQRVLGVEGVADPDNVGGLFRTALAFGVDAVLLDGVTVDPLYRKAIRTSMAAALRLPFARVDPWLDGLASLRAAGFELVALTPRAGAVELARYASRAASRLAVLVGSEASGLTEATLRAADVHVRIPVDPRADSLNVVTAAGIALHALRSG